MFALIRFVGRRVTNKRLAKSTWLRRLFLLIAIAKWITRFLDKPSIVRLRKNESATVILRRSDGSK